MMKTNFHTHTTYCDGKSTPEEIVKAAIEKNFDVIGFSGHSYTEFDESYCMSRDDTKKYKNEIGELKEKYKDKIGILCGIEQDYYSCEETSDYDYVIGSVHAFFKENSLTAMTRYIYVDYSKKTLEQAVFDFYEGDFYAMAEDYFSVVSDVVRKTKCDIIGHFDLLTKFNENGCLFDENHPRYQAAAFKAVDVLLKTGAIFEINTGAMSKRYRSMPYPSAKILKKIHQGGGKIILSSDSHISETLDFAFEEALHLAKSCGFRNVQTINKYGEFISMTI